MRRSWIMFNLWFSMLVDLPTRIGVYGMSLNAVYSVLAACATCFHVIATRAPGGVIPPLLWFFVLWAAFSVLWGETQGGLQQATVLCLFLGTITLAAKEEARQFIRRVETTMIVGAVVASLVVLALIPFDYSIHGFKLIGPRPYAVWVQIGLALLVTRVASRRGGPGGWAGVIAVLSALALSGARMGFVAALVNAGVTVYVSITRARRSVLTKMVLWLCIAVLAVLAFNYATVGERILALARAWEQVIRDPASPEARMLTSGRSIGWVITLRSAMGSPLIGKGGGSSGRVLYETLQSEYFAHPHNDYLRILHDYGLVGLLAFVGGMLALLTRLRRASSIAQCPLSSSAMAAPGALVSYLVLMLTDNALVYSFSLIPLGITLGFALGAVRRALPISKEGRQWGLGSGFSPTPRHSQAASQVRLGLPECPRFAGDGS